MNKEEKKTTEKNTAAGKSVKKDNPSEKIEKETKKSVLSDVDEGDGEDDILFYKRKSVDLSPENAKFSPSEGGLVSLTLINADGKEEFFERVSVIRSFPITDPDVFISIREPDTKTKEKGSEIGLIANINSFDEVTVALLKNELNKRYFSPKILKITGVKEKQGYIYWDAETDAGKFNFVIRNASANIRTLEDGRVLMFDIDGNCFEIPDPEKMDKASFRRIEIYM